MPEQELDQAQAREIIKFQISYNKQKIKTTWALAAIIIIIFGLEEYFGGSQNLSVLVRMGANVGERVRQGEYYRLFSSVFLHAGLMHVFFNTYVLFALGGFFNRILGESKYLVVFLVSGVCGSLSSVFFGKSAVSVGASGAIWGLFGASLVLALFKTSLIPEPIRLRLRRITIINLIINLGVSFLPMIDFWAHIGGGLGGFLVSLIMVFAPKNLQVAKLIDYGFRLMAFLLAALYLASLVYGMTIYTPWQNPWQSSFKEVDLVQIPFKVGVPASLKFETQSAKQKESFHFVFGTPLEDSIIVDMQFFNQAIFDDKADKDWLIKQRDEMLKESAIPADVKKTIYFRENLHGGLLYYQQKFKNNDLIVHNYVLIKNKYMIKLGLIAAENIKQTDVDDLANKIIERISFTGDT